MREKERDRGRETDGDRQRRGTKRGKERGREREWSLFVIFVNVKNCCQILHNLKYKSQKSKLSDINKSGNKQMKTVLHKVK